MEQPGRHSPLSAGRTLSSGSMSTHLPDGSAQNIQKGNLETLVFQQVFSRWKCQCLMSRTIQKEGRRRGYGGVGSKEYPLILDSCDSCVLTVTLMDRAEDVRCQRKEARRGSARLGCFCIAIYNTRTSFTLKICTNECAPNRFHLPTIETQIECNFS